MIAERGQFIREGKAKILYHTATGATATANATANANATCIIQYFKDDATAFNAQKKGTIKQKGEINNAISSWIFEYLEKKGVPTHFVSKLSEREMLVKKVAIIPVEVVVRNRATGSITKRLGLEKGAVFTPPLIEFFYKSDELGDPLISETHIFHFGWATKPELEKMKDLALTIDRLLLQVFDEVGLELIDFKLEFGKVATGEIVLADEFTPDGARLWDKKTGESMDKDRFRQDMGRVEESYQEVFQRLRNFFSGRTSV